MKQKKRILRFLIILASMYIPFLSLGAYLFYIGADLIDYFLMIPILFIILEFYSYGINRR